MMAATDPSPRILVSACRLGERVRYDGGHTHDDDATLTAWQAAGRLVAVCPEVMAGASVPRPPGEILGPGGGIGVLDGDARVVEPDGRDVTALYVAGAERALAVALAEDCRFALLQDRSPSCGSTVIYDGTHQGRRIPGTGVTTALLERHGIRVFATVDALAEALTPGLRAAD